MTEINLFGELHILVDGADVTRAAGISRKQAALLAFLILHRQRSFSAVELAGSLWPQEEGENPESAMKTLVSRLRKSLSGIGLDRAILTVNGMYRWNDAQEKLMLDVPLAEELIARIRSQSKITASLRGDMDRLLVIYPDDLLTEFAAESWAAGKSARYHTMVLDAILHYIELLKAQGDFIEIYRVGRIALYIDPLDTKLNLEVMNALLRMGRAAEALDQYERTTNAHYGRLGIKPSEEILAFYKELIKTERGAKSDLDEIIRDLRDPANESSGAFICEYAVFKDIYRLTNRNIQRSGSTMFLALVTLHDRSGEDGAAAHLLLDKTMRRLMDVMAKALRKGDVVARFSPSQYALLLPCVNLAAAHGVLERVRKAFYTGYSDNRYLYSYKLTSVAEEAASL